MSRAAGVFVACLAAAALFVAFSGSALPATVASHFDGAGDANGFMPRADYLRFMFGFVVVLPAVLTLLVRWQIGRPGARINLPNRDWWLDPARREDTIAWLREQMCWFTTLLVLLLAFAHWRVLVANRLVPPHLSAQWMFAGLGTFFVAVAWWLKAMFRRFRLPAR